MKFKNLITILAMSIVSFSVAAHVSDEKDNDPVPSQYENADAAESVVEGNEINSNSEEYLEEKFKQLDESIYKTEAADQYICQPWPRC